ncbi:hypothetical protein B0H14DRAFT_2605468 [Mycena olivaceomarginata]|nr:hypothetical protein B0H14DRAFT_2605468 [Mycena olivaceomarginata]
MQRQKEFVLAMSNQSRSGKSVGTGLATGGPAPKSFSDEAAITEELKAAICGFGERNGQHSGRLCDAAIVFKNAASGEIYVVAAKGAFEVLTAGYKINLANLNWKSLPFFPTESAFKNALEGINIVDTARLKTGGAVYLGRAWHEKHQCFVRIDRLLEQMSPQSIPENELLDLLEDETFKALALSCKTRGLVQNLRDWLLAKYEQPRDMPAIHRPHLENSPLLPRISRCLEKLTALENTGFDVGILEWSSHRSMSAAEAVSSPKVDQEPEVLKAHSSTSTTGAHACNMQAWNLVYQTRLGLKRAGNPVLRVRVFSKKFEIRNPIHAVDKMALHKRVAFLVEARDRYEVQSEVWSGKFLQVRVSPGNFRYLPFSPASTSFNPPPAT